MFKQSTTDHPSCTLCSVAYKPYCDSLTSKIYRVLVAVKGWTMQVPAASGPCTYASKGLYATVSFVARMRLSHLMLKAMIMCVAVKPDITQPMT